MRGGSCLLAWHVRGAAGPQCDRHELLLGVKADDDEFDSSGVQFNRHLKLKA